MHNIYKVILGIFVCIFIVYSGLGVLQANTEAIAAENYLNKVANEVSASNLNENIIKDCQTQATENGYTLIYEIIENSNGSVAYATLRLEYRYTVGFMKLSGVHYCNKFVF